MKTKILDAPVCSQDIETEILGTSYTPLTIICEVKHGKMHFWFLDESVNLETKKRIHIEMEKGLPDSTFFLTLP